MMILRPGCNVLGGFIVAKNEQDSALTRSMKFLGGVAGFLWGGHIGNLDPEIGIFVGMIGGTAIGAIAGWIAGKTLEATLRLAFALFILAFIALRLLQIFNVIGSFAA